MSSRQDLVQQTVNNFLTLYFYEHRKDKNLRLQLTALVDRCVDEHPEYGFRKAAILVREYDFEDGKLTHYPAEGSERIDFPLPVSPVEEELQPVLNATAIIPTTGYVDSNEVRKLFPTGTFGQQAFDKAFRGCTMVVQGDSIMMPVEDLHDYMLRRNFRD